MKVLILKSINKYWPKITLGFNGYNHILSPINYFIIYSLLGKINACVGFEKTDKNYNILGTTFLKGYDVIFDNEDKKIGFIESNCDIKIKNIKKTELNEEYMNRVFDDPVNIIIVCISIGGIIIMVILVLCVIFTGLFFSLSLEKLENMKKFQYKWNYYISFSSLCII